MDGELERVQLQHPGERFPNDVWGLEPAAGADDQHQHRGHYGHDIVWRDVHGPDLGDQRVGHRLNHLVLDISYATIGGLAITDVVTNWAKPYLLNFTFSLRDGPDPATDSAVVVPPSQLQVVCMETLQNVPVPVQVPTNETAVVLESALKKQLKSYLVLDYTYSMLAVPGAIDSMQAAAELLINEEPTHAQFGIYQFNAEYVNPQLVTTNGLMADKAALIADIEGIQTNYVKGNYAGTRCWDAMYAALKQFGPFGPTNYNEQRFLVVMTDGNDTSSLLNTNADPVGTLVSLAQTNQVQIFCVAFGNNVNTNSLLELTTQTGGHYYLAATTTGPGHAVPEDCQGH